MHKISHVFVLNSCDFFEEKSIVYLNNSRLVMASHRNSLRYRNEKTMLSQHQRDETKSHKVY